MRQRRTRMVCVCGALAALFDPVMPVHMSKSVWMLVDLGRDFYCLRAAPSAVT
jgi:hypothetical protein